MSFDSPWRWTDGQLAGFREGLDDPQAEVQVFQMDVKRHRGDAAVAFARGSGEFREIAGNTRISLTLLAPRGRIRATRDREVVARWPVLTDPSNERVLVLVRVGALASVLRGLPAEGARLDHLCDF